MWPEIKLEYLGVLDTPLSLGIKKGSDNPSFAGFIFFDVGSVLIDLNWDNFYQGVQNIFPKDSAFNVSLFVDDITQQGIIHDWSIGRLPASEYAKKFLHILKNHCSSSKYINLTAYDVKRLNDLIVGHERPQVIQLIKKLKLANYAVGILSNSTYWHEALIEKKLSARDLFDVCIYSQDVGYEKPDLEIYQIAYKEAAHFVMNNYSVQLEKKDLYFIDDTPINILTARNEGWNASLVNLLKNDILIAVKAGKISAEDLNTLSRKKENLIFAQEAALRIEELFGKLL